MSEPIGARIFLSYASEDREKVRQLYQDLKEAGFQPWWDQDMLPGEDWKFAIRQALCDSDFFLTCLSTNSVTKRGYVQKELKMALDIFEEFPEGEIYLIPVRLEDIPIPESLRSIQWSDLFLPGSFEMLYKAINIQMRHQPNQGSGYNAIFARLPPAMPLLPAKKLEFINRVHESEEIRNPGGPQLVVLDAPSGYGKSRLLVEVENWYKSQKADKWICARIELNSERYVKLPQLVLDGIARQVIGEPVESGNPEELIGKIVDQGKHVILLFDAADANRPATKWLQDNFISLLMDAQKHTTLIWRVVFAGRYIQGDDWGRRNNKVIKLTPIDDDVIRQAVLKELEGIPLTPSIKDVLAREAAFLSCGHPGIIEKILRYPLIGGWALAMKGEQLKPETHKILFQECVKPVIDDIFGKARDENLIESLRIVSVFRRFDLNTVQALQMLAKRTQFVDSITQTLQELTGGAQFVDLLGPFFRIQDDAMNLLTRLVGTGLVSDPTSDKPFYHDAIIRKLVLLELQMQKMEMKNDYRRLNALAYAIYDAWIDGTNIDGRKLPIPLTDQIQADYMAEGLYHLLNCLDKRQRDDNYKKISSKVEWYVERLCSSFYDKNSLLRSLKKTVERDADIPDLLQELVGEDGERDILDALD